MFQDSYDQRPSTFVVAPVFVFALALSGPAEAQPAGFVRVDSGTCCMESDRRDVVVADVDADGHLDLVAAELNSAGPGPRLVSVVFGDGNGRFHRAAHYEMGLGGGDDAVIQNIFAGDVNGDGRADLVARLSDVCFHGFPCNGFATDHLAVRLSEAGGTFSAPVRTAVSASGDAAAGDVNGDGRLDVVFGAEPFEGLGVRVLLGAPTGSFDFLAHQPFDAAAAADTLGRVWALELADITRDGRLDLVAFHEMNLSTQVRVAPGLGDGGFAMAAASVLRLPLDISIDTAAGDVTGDGLPDVLAGDFFGLQLFANDAGSLLPPVDLAPGSWTRSPLIGDLSLDDRPDILTWLFRPQNDWMILVAAGAPGAFLRPQLFSIGHDTALGLGDFNDDGRLDVVGVNGAGGVFALLNQPPDLTITMTPIHEFHVGGVGTYELTVTNIGPGASVGTILVRDRLPAGLTYISATGAEWTCSAVAADVRCQRGIAVTAGGASTITLVVGVTVIAPELVTNTADVIAQGDYDAANDTARVETKVGRPNLALSKTASDTMFDVGSTQQYTLTVRNVGTFGLGAHQAMVSDTLPAGISLVSADGCTALDAVVTCTIDHLDVGSTATFVLVVRVGFETGGVVVNRAIVSHPYDADPTNDSATVARFVQLQPTLAVDLLRERVSTLAVDEGVLRGLTKTLQGILQSLGGPAPEPAIHRLGAFKHQVQAFDRAGKLASADAASLIVGADMTIEALALTK